MSSHAPTGSHLYLCPDCLAEGRQSLMLVRQVRNGGPRDGREFLACSRYPACRRTVRLAGGVPAEPLRDLATAARERIRRATAKEGGGRG